MQTQVLTIRKHDVAAWLGALLKRGEVIAPCVGPCGEVVFSEVQSAERVLWDFENPLTPPKRFVLPQTDALVQIECDKTGVNAEPVYGDRPRILFNVRPCDAKGIAFLTRMHEMEPPDASYLRRAANITVVTLACNTPCTQGFCICSDSGPFLRTGRDIQLIDLGDKVVAEIGSDKGVTAVSSAAHLFSPSSEEDIRRRENLESEAKTHFGNQTCHFASAMRRISTRRVDDALWEEMSDWCLECGGCNFICPTCYCFSVKDRRSGDGWTRCRTWDSCQYAAFTLEASGHNPRSRTRDRMKRRFFHKVSAQ